MTDIIMRRVPHGLVPSNEAEWENLTNNKIALGQECRCKITVPRNLQFHKKYMKMLRETFHMQDSYKNFEHWRTAVQIAAGHCDPVITHSGDVSYIVKSISFANCDQTMFDNIYQDVLQAICDHWIHDEPEQLRIILEFI